VSRVKVSRVSRVTTTLRRVSRVTTTLRNPLNGARGARGLLPLVIEEVVEVAVVPLGRGGCPSTLDRGCYGDDVMMLW
jgi:nitrogen-specific signal transduction histidine kinase